MILKSECLKKYLAFFLVSPGEIPYCFDNSPGLFLKFQNTLKGENMEKNWRVIGKDMNADEKKERVFGENLSEEEALRLLQNLVSHAKTDISLRGKYYCGFTNGYHIDIVGPGNQISEEAVYRSTPPAEPEASEPEYEYDYDHDFDYEEYSGIRNVLRNYVQYDIFHGRKTVRKVWEFAGGDRELANELGLGIYEDEKQG